MATPSVLATRPVAKPSVSLAGPGTVPVQAPVASEALSTVAPPGSQIAILAPLTGPNAERGAALVAAAKLALTANGSPTLVVFDTASTADGAASAASQAIAAGAAMLIGPLTSAETAAAAGPATQAGVPMLAFTNDATQARPGVWTLGLTPAQQLRRLVGALAAQGKTRITAVLAQDAFGQAMATALTDALAEAALPPPVIRFHAGTMQSANTTMRDVSDYGNRRGPLDAQIRAARTLGTAEGRKKAAELVKHPVPPPPMDALLLSDFGDNLHTLASLLPYYDIDPPAVRVIGPALWSAPQVTDEAELKGAWYAAPDPALRADFATHYEAANGAPPPGLADFAYDAASIARALAIRGEGYSTAALCRPEGFAGVNGLLALQPDGRVRRGLAIFEIQRGGATIVDASPDTLGAPGM